MDKNACWCAQLFGKRGDGKMSMFESLAHYFLKPVALWLLVIFVAQAFFWPMMTTWAGDLLSMFLDQAIDQLKWLIW